MTSNASSLPALRKTRIVCVSDTHNQTPKLPAGDVLIHAGDLTNQGSLSELERTIAWLEKAPFEVKIVVAGNHDITLDSAFYEKHGSYFHNQYPQSPEACQALLNSSPTITYLQHESRQIYLSDPKGPQTVFKVFGSPYSPAQGNWAFQYDTARARTVWDDIPLNTDVVVTHAPPKNHCDSSASNRSRGCEDLRRALWRVRPSLAVCGHTHEGRGVERVRWKLDLPLCPYLEEKTKHWTDPGAGNNKLSLIDLTSKSGRQLENFYDSRFEAPKSPNRVSFSPPPKTAQPLTHTHQCRIGRSRRRSESRSRSKIRFHSRSRTRSRSRVTKSTIVVSRGLQSTTADQTDQSKDKEDDLTHLEEWYSRLDGLNTAALHGRLEKKETCVVNAAITGTSWGKGAKRFNKPVVVDIDLPMWDGASTTAGDETISSGIS